MKVRIKKACQFMMIITLMWIMTSGCAKESHDAYIVKEDGATFEETEATTTETVSTEQIAYAEELSPDEIKINNEISDMLDYMTLEEKVAQLFIIFPESLVDGVPCVTVAEEATKESVDNIPVGGVVYLSQNLRSSEQVKNMLSNIQNYSMERINLPMFLCVDEEGGEIARIANNSAFGQTNVGDMAAIGDSNDKDMAYITGENIGAYLSELGFNLDFAPVVDVSGGVSNPVIGRRSFSSEPEIVSKMAAALSKGLEDKGVVSVYKHFPGHGSTVGDPHKGYAYTNKSIEDLKECDLIPFQYGIDENVSMIMVGHISTPNIVKEGTPASLSRTIIKELLRDDMGYDGIIVTDAMNMGAITDNYTSDEASVLALQAGVDIVLMPKDFKEAYYGVINAVKNGTLSEDRIDESVIRILRLKLRMRE